MIRECEECTVPSKLNKMLFLLAAFCVDTRLVVKGYELKLCPESHSSRWRV